MLVTAYLGHCPKVLEQWPVLKECAMQNHIRHLPVHTLACPTQSCVTCAPFPHPLLALFPALSVQGHACFKRVRRWAQAVVVRVASSLITGLKVQGCNVILLYVTRLYASQLCHVIRVSFAKSHLAPESHQPSNLAFTHKHALVLGNLLNQRPVRLDTSSRARRAGLEAKRKYCR